MQGSDEHHAPAVLPLGKKALWSCRSDLRVLEKTEKPQVPAGIRTPDRQAHSLSYTDNKNSTAMICPTQCDTCNLVGAHFYLE